jgi:hypothetical protein
MRVFKNKHFSRFAKKERISDKMLCKAVQDAEQGTIDADLGGGVIKQRIARPNEGKSGGYRAIIIYKQAERSFFVYGFAKKDQDNISKDDEKAFKEAAKILLAYSDSELDAIVSKGVFEEIECYEQNETL